MAGIYSRAAGGVSSETVRKRFGDGGNGQYNQRLKGDRMIATNPPPTPEQKRAALDEVLASHTFARSDQLRSFLRFVCEKEMVGGGGEINEYLIGVEALGRSADYSPAEDATVRNRAYALRNKLQEFYSHEKPDARVRIELHKGSYCPHYVECEPAAAEVARPAPEKAAEAVSPSPKAFAAGATAVNRPGRRWRWVAAALLAAVALTAAAFTFNRLRPPRTALDEFWEPVLASRQPVLICTSQPVVYHLTGQAKEKVSARLKSLPAGQASSYDLAPDDEVRGADVVAVEDQYVGVGSAQAAAQFSALFGRLGKPSQIRISREASFADLRHSPVVLIGAFGNRWTMSMSGNLRFVFEEKAYRHRVIVDKSEPQRVWGSSDMPVTGKVSEDYAIVSRIFQSETGEVMITAAGITQYGTRAAGEFLSNPASLNELASRAPAGWQKKNLQVVLAIKVIDNTPGPPTIVTSHFW